MQRYSHEGTENQREIRDNIDPDTIQEQYVYSAIGGRRAEALSDVGVATNGDGP